MPWITPNRLTADDPGEVLQRQARRSAGHGCPHRRCCTPDGRRRSARAWSPPGPSRRPATLTSVGTVSTVGAGCAASSSPARAEHRPLDVGDDELHPLGGEAPGHRQPDAGCAARDDGDLAGEVLASDAQQVGRVEQIGIVLQLPRRPVVADPPALEDERPVGQPEGDVGELLDEQHPDTRLGDRPRGSARAA